MATGDIFITEMTLSAERIVEIRDECFADDVEIPLGLEYCSEVTVREPLRAEVSQCREVWCLWNQILQYLPEKFNQTRHRANRQLLRFNE